MIVKRTDNVIATPKARMSVFPRQLLFTGPLEAQRRGTKKNETNENGMKGGGNRKIMRVP
jgi:hypothetical protein